MCRAIVENVLSGTKAGFKATRNLVFNQKAERSTMNRQKSRAIVENVLSGTKAGFKAILNFEHAIERKKMDHQKSKSTFSAIVLTLTLMVAAFWVNPAAVAAEKKIVKDPATGEMVAAPEYGGTITYGYRYRLQLNTDTTQRGHAAGMFVSGVLEKLGIGDWACSRGVYNHQPMYVPMNCLTGQLAESWEVPDNNTVIFKIRKGVKWHNKAPMNGRELTADDVVFSFNRYAALEGNPRPNFNYTVINMGIKKITAPDKYTVVFDVPVTPTTVWTFLTEVNLWIAPPEVIKQDGDGSIVKFINNCTFLIPCVKLSGVFVSLVSTSLNADS